MSMTLPNFLLADNSDLPEQIFILHTQYPRFLWDVQHDDVEWLDEIDETVGEDQLINDIANLLDSAEAFYQREMKRGEETMLESDE